MNPWAEFVGAKRSCSTVPQNKAGCTIAIQACSYFCFYYVALNTVNNCEAIPFSILFLVHKQVVEIDIRRWIGKILHSLTFCHHILSCSSRSRRQYYEMFAFDFNLYTGIWRDQATLARFDIINQIM